MIFTYISIPRTGSRSVHKALKTGMKDNHKPISIIDNPGFSFCFMRDPSERIESWFSSSRYETPDLQSIYGHDINQWVDNGCLHHWDLWCNPLYQWKFVEINGKLGVDFIGDFAKMNMQLQLLSDTYLKVGKMNVPVLGKNKGIHQNLSDSSVKKLKEMFPKDYELYDKIKSNGCIRK